MAYQGNLPFFKRTYGSSSYRGVLEPQLFTMVNIIYIFFVICRFQVKRLSIFVICTCFINSNQKLHLTFNAAAVGRDRSTQSGYSNNLSQTVTESAVSLLTTHVARWRWHFKENNESSRTVCVGILSAKMKRATSKMLIFLDSELLIQTKTTIKQR